MLQNVYAPTPVVKQATTPPPKVVALKFHVAPSSPLDGDIMNFEFIELGFGYQESDKDGRSAASAFRIDIQDLDTDITKSYIQYAFNTPYYYWQRSVDNITDGQITDTEAAGGIVNARVTVTPVNDKSTGLRSTFILPLKDMDYITKDSWVTNPTTHVLAKYWHLYSMTPEEVYNRPKVMHIYMDTPREDILLDKEELNDTKWRYNTYGDYQEVNQEMFRWVIEDDNVFTKLVYDEFITMQSEEIEFIEYLLESINDRYRRYVANSGLEPSDPVVFKIAVENPRDHDDSIIIYIMKGSRWQI